VNNGLVASFSSQNENASTRVELHFIAYARQLAGNGKDNASNEIRENIAIMQQQRLLFRAPRPPICLSHQESWSVNARGKGFTKIQGHPVE
jgi:hypothetical protein